MTQLKLEIQKLQEELLLSTQLSDSRQSQIDILHTQLQDSSSKLDEVCLVFSVYFRPLVVNWSCVVT